MTAFDQLGVGQPRLDSVPLMGGAPGLGLGLALARPDQGVIVVDGDASLLMQLGGLVTVAEAAPTNFHHFVVHNGTQFTGLSNLSICGAGQGRATDLAGMARAAGYAAALCHDDLEAFEAALPAILALAGPVFIELKVRPDPPTFGPDRPQGDWSDRQFTRMGEGAAQLSGWLGQGRASR